MNYPEETTAADQVPDLTAAHAPTILLERLADKLGARASVAAVYGEPITGAGVTVIPVARVGFGFGGGSGREVRSDKTGEGGGGGGGVGSWPLGFIEIRDGIATYKPIRRHWTDVIVPLAALAVALAPKIIRTRRKRRT